jgi:hypothetical protein
VAVKVAKALHTDPAWLWQTLAPRLRMPDLVHIYDQFADVPKALWLSLGTSADKRITIASATAPILPTQELTPILQASAARGVPVQGVHRRPHPHAAGQRRDPPVTTDRHDLGDVDDHDSVAAALAAAVGQVRRDGGWPVGDHGHKVDQVEAASGKTVAKNSYDGSAAGELDPLGRHPQHGVLSQQPR